MKKRFLIVGFVFGLLIAGLSFSGYQVFSSSKNYTQVRNIPAVVPVFSNEVTSLQSAFVYVSKMVKPSVVQITTEKTITYRYWDPFGDRGGSFNSPFEDFFNMPPKREEREPKTFKKKQQGLGSGFIVDENGYILTNNHVIDGVDKILVKLFNDDRKYEAKVIGTDKKTDLALIKINIRKKLTPVILGNSDKIEVGEWVIAIGNPMGLEETVTVGVISAKGRSGFGITQYEDFIQTDAAINPGNSGGPLVNIKGAVIGINTFILAPYAAQNIGFAIPVSLAKKVFSQLKEKGRVIRGYLGVYLQPLSEELAKSFGLEDAKGSLVAKVISGSPAEKAGIKAGDVIIEYNGKEIEDVKTLQMEVANTPVGEKTKVVIWRNKKKVSLTVKTGEMDEEEKIVKVTSEEKEWRGLQVSEITEEIKNKFGIENDEKGVIVVSVEPGSPADEEGIVPGTIIKMIDSYNTVNLSDYKKAIEKVSGNKSVRLWVKQGGQQRFLVLKSEK